MGRKSGISPPERRLRAAFANALSTAIGNDRGGQSSAARRLGTSRQAISLYIHQKATPGPEILRRACTEFNLKFEVEGLRLDSGSFAKPQKIQQIPVQTSIFEAIAEVEKHSLDITVLRKHAHSIDLKVSINFKPTATPP